MHLDTYILVYFIHSKKRCVERDGLWDFIWPQRVREFVEVTKGLGQAGQIPSHKPPFLLVSQRQSYWFLGLLLPSLGKLLVFCSP